jgi:hypothetical protein
MKFNMGCGHNRREGYVNVDSAPESAADEIWNLEQTPWPWPDSCAEEVLFIHSLEHMGRDTDVFLAIVKELYRICAPGAVVVIHAPDPRHDTFLDDPTHVRAITRNMLALFDRERNDAWRAQGLANTPLAHYTGVDFRIVEHRAILAPEYLQAVNAGEVAREDLPRLARERNNVVLENRIRLEARKPAG